MPELPNDNLRRIPGIRLAMSGGLLLVWFLLPGDAASRVAAQNAPDRTTQIRELVNRLSSNHRVERVRAEEELVTLKLSRAEGLTLTETGNQATRLAVRRILRQVQTATALEQMTGRREKPEILLPQQRCDAITVAPGVIQTSARLTRVRLETDERHDLLKVHVRLKLPDSLELLTVTFQEANLTLNWNGTVCSPFSPDSDREIHCSGTEAEFPLAYLIPKTGLNQSGTLHGGLRLRLAAGEEEISFPLDSTEPEIQSVGQTEARLISSHVGRQGLEIQVQIASTPGEKWESYQAEHWLRHLAVRLQSGETVSPSERILSEITGSPFQIDARFSQVRSLQPGDRLVHRLPAIVVWGEFQIELRDLSLPIPN